MTKSEIIAHMALGAGITQAQAKEALSAYTDAAHTVLELSKRFVLPNIGILTVTARPARDGRNPRTGEKLKIAAGKKITFKAAKELKDAV